MGAELEEEPTQGIVATSDFKALRDSVEQSFEDLKEFRERRVEFLKEYIGGHYGQMRGSRPNNLIYRYIAIMRRALTPNSPAAKVETFIASQKPAANSFEQALNAQLKDMKIVRPLQLAVIEGMVGMGIIKVGLNDSGTVEIGGILHDTQEPFAEVVQFENFVWDTDAETLEQAKYFGNKYSMTVEDIKDSGLFPDADLDLIGGHSDEWQDDGGEDRAREFTTGNRLNTSNYKKSVCLWDVWVPRDNVIVTYLDKTNIVLREVPWHGVEEGPYHFLRFDVVPGNIMPIPPISQLLDLHKINNKIMVKVANQAMRQKKVTAVGNGGEGDANRLTNARDGDAVKVSQGSDVTETEMGGVSAGNVQMVGVTDEMFSKNAGNLNVLGGLGTGADTVGQEKILAGSSSKQVQDMADQVKELSSGVIRAIGWYLWDDPLTDVPIRKTVPGVPDVEVLTRFNQDTKTGDLEDFGIDVHPYSLQGRSPAEEVQTILQLVAQFYLPLLQQAEAQGMKLDVVRLFTLMGDNLNIPALQEVFVAEQPLTDKGATSERNRPKQAAHTVRENIRHQATPTKEKSPFEEMASTIESSQGAKNNA